MTEAEAAAATAAACAQMRSASASAMQQQCSGRLRRCWRPSVAKYAISS